MFCEMDPFKCLFRVIFSVSEKRVNMEVPKGGGYAIRSCRRMFREGRPLSTWLRFGLHFGSILGAQVGTILLFGLLLVAFSLLFSSPPKKLPKNQHKHSIWRLWLQNDPQSVPRGSPKGGQNPQQIITKSSLSRRGCLQVTSRG